MNSITSILEVILDAKIVILNSNVDIGAYEL